MHRIFNLALACGCFLLIPSNAAAQQDSPELKHDLQHIAAEANDLDHSLPSFTCEESAVSQAIRNNKVRRNVQASGLLRMMRDSTGKLSETYTFKRDHILFFIPSSLPIYVSGGFDSALSYFSASSQACYRFSLSPGRIDFQARTDPISAHACKERGLKGFALLNADGDVSHIERTIPADVASPLKLATFASIDLAPVDLNGHTYQLSHHMVAEMPITGATGHFEATYTNCHLFTATVTLGPSTEVPPDTTPKPQ
jgi:hypothetical protein